MRRIFSPDGRRVPTPRLAPSIALLVAILLAALGTACTGTSVKGAQPQADAAIPVKIQVAQSVPISDTTEYVATLKSRDAAIIMPQVEGQITDIYVHSGDHVTPGTVLMQIDPTKQQATVNSQEHSRAAQEANLDYAQQQYNRISALAAAGVVAKQDLDQAKSALDTAKAQLKSLDAQVQEQQTQLHYYRVSAPSTGIVGDIPVHVGDRVTTTTMLTSVDKPGSLEAYVYIPVERSSQLKMNMPVQIVDGSGQVMADSRISFISPQVDNTTQTVLIKSRVGGQYFAFVAEDEKGKLVAHQKAVRIGDMAGNDYVVLEGIKPGDKVIVSGVQFLVDGATVSPQG